MLINPIFYLRWIRIEFELLKTIWDNILQFKSCPKNVFNHLRAKRIFFSSQGPIYTFLMHSTLTHCICTAGTKDVYVRPLTVSRATKLFSYQQLRTYKYVFLLFRVRPNYFHVSNQERIYTSLMYFPSSQRRIYTSS